MVLVMDDAATRVISSALTMYDIMERRVTLVEQLARPRQPFKEMDAIYLMAPTTESANLLLQDFQNDKQSKYGGVHLYFLDTVRGHVAAARYPQCSPWCVLLSIRSPPT